MVGILREEDNVLAVVALNNVQMIARIMLASF
jgi:hypothetical protein